MRRTIQRVVLPTLLATLLAQAACSVPRHPPGLLEGGADGLPTAEIAEEADVCEIWHWPVLSPGGDEGGVEPRLAGTNPAITPSEGGADGFTSLGAAGLPDAPWCFASGIWGGWRPQIAGLGEVSTWLPFSGDHDAAEDGDTGGGYAGGGYAGGGYSGGGYSGGGQPWRPGGFARWPTWPGSDDGSARGGTGDTGLAGPPSLKMVGDSRGEQSTTPRPRDGAGPPSIVHEPGTLALVGAAMVALGLYRRGRRAAGAFRSNFGKTDTQ